MIRRYCDICGREIEEKASFNRIKRERYHEPGRAVQVEVMVAFNKTWNTGDICELCVLDAVNNGTDVR